jgi:hypothetical protein
MVVVDAAVVLEVVPGEDTDHNEEGQVVMRRAIGERHIAEETRRRTRRQAFPHEGQGPSFPRLLGGPRGRAAPEKHR